MNIKSYETNGYSNGKVGTDTMNYAAGCCTCTCTCSCTCSCASTATETQKRS